MPDHDDRPPWAGPDPAVRGLGGYDQRPEQPVPLSPYGPYGAPVPRSPAPVDVRVVGAATGTRGLALAGVAMGGVALLGVLLLAVFVGVTLLGPDGSAAGGNPRHRRAFVGQQPGRTVARRRDRAPGHRRGGVPEGISCPSTPKVAQDVTTVCHGDVDGEEWAFVVFFEDAEGHYTLLEV